jgi:hypothetical protein
MRALARALTAMMAAMVFVLDCPGWIAVGIPVYFPLALSMSAVSRSGR